MKIAYLFENYPATTESFLAREVAALRRANHDIEVWALQAGEGAKTVAAPPRALKLLGKSRFFEGIGENWGREIAASGATHVHATWANHLAVIAQGAAKVAGLPWSFAAHARDLWVEGGDLGAKLSSAKFAAVCTREGETELCKHGANVLFAPHGLPLDEFPFQTWQKGRELRVLGVGRLVEKKGWTDLVAAASICARREQRGAQYGFQIVGEGPLRGALQKQIDALGVGDFVTLGGALSREETIAAMQEANCFVLPSRRALDGDRDGLPNVLLEAAALGLPIVTSDHQGARDFADADTALLFPSMDVERLAGAIAGVRSMPDATTQRALAARARVEAEFDVEKNVRVLAQAFES